MYAFMCMPRLSSSSEKSVYGGRSLYAAPATSPTLPPLLTASLAASFAPVHLCNTYFPNAAIRILTTGDLRNPLMLQCLLATHAAHTSAPLADRLPRDTELIIADGAVRSIHSRVDVGASHHIDDATGLFKALKTEYWVYMAAFPA